MTEKLRDNDREEQAQENGEDGHKNSQLHVSTFLITAVYFIFF